MVSQWQTNTVSCLSCEQQLTFQNAVCQQECLRALKLVYLKYMKGFLSIAEVVHWLQ